MKLAEEEVYEILKAEVSWCEQNPDKELSPDCQSGFIAGLKQAQLLIETAEKERWNVEWRMILSATVTSKQLVRRDYLGEIWLNSQT